MKILIAGATGLVGSAIVRKFEKLQHEVIGISTKNLNLLER